MVWARIARQPLQPYGASAAEYIEHLARLRLVLRLEGGELHDLGGLVRAVDGLYPPLLHLVTGAWGALFGHSAEAAVASGPLWWVALAGAMGVLAHRLELGRGAALVGTMLVPALAAVSTRYYYDLPMTALLWWGVALLPGRDRPGWGVGSALFWSLAAITKWTALPFVLPMAFGGALSLGGRWRVLLPSSAPFLLAAGWLAFGGTSLGAMSETTFRAPDLLQVGLAGVVEASLLELQHDGWYRLRFYPLRMVATVLSPIGAAVIALLALRWARTGARGLVLVVAVVLGQVGFLILMVPPLDDRFILTAAPALVLVAAGGVTAMGTPRWLAWALVVLGLGLAADVQLRPSGIGLSTDAREAMTSSVDGSGLALRAGVGSSMFQRGWSRSEHTPPSRRALRAAVQERLARCPDDLSLSSPKPAITPSGDAYWWRYQAALAAVRRGEGAVGTRVVPWPDHDRVDLLVVAHPPTSFAPPAPSPSPSRWLDLAWIEDPDGGGGLRLYARSATTCPALVGRAATP